MFNEQYELVLMPEKNVCIDKPLIPFRESLSFCQYIPNKRHKYGIKLFKICSERCYTYNLSSNAGKKNKPKNNSVAEDVVLNLIDNLLGYNRTLYTDNRYRSVNLANELLKQSKNLVGTARKNRVGFLKDVILMKIKKANIFKNKTIMEYWY